MLSRGEVLAMITDLESDRIERTVSVREDKIGEAVCSFSNDYANHKKSGYIFLGVKDSGEIAGITIGDDQLKTIGGVRSNGNNLPQPSLTVSEVLRFDKGDIVVIEVFPAFHPPVRFKGKCCIRIGPRKAIANEAEERRLSEKRTSTAKTFDALPFPNSKLEDLDLEIFKSSYLPLAVAKETLAENHRTEVEKLASLRLYDIVHDCPTHAGYIVMQYTAKERRPVKSYLKWANRIPNVYQEYVLNENTEGVTIENDTNCVGLLKHYHSLAPMAMEARKPIFLLKPADGAIGSHFQAVHKSYNDFEEITQSILRRINGVP